METFHPSVRVRPVSSRTRSARSWIANVSSSSISFVIAERLVSFSASSALLAAFSAIFAALTIAIASNILRFLFFGLSSPIRTKKMARRN